MGDRNEQRIQERHDEERVDGESGILTLIELTKKKVPTGMQLVPSAILVICVPFCPGFASQILLAAADLSRQSHPGGSCPRARRTKL